MSVATLETYRDAAIAALVSADYTVAIRNALAAKMLLATMANAMRGTGGGNQQQMSWDRDSIDQFISQCRILQSQAAHADSTSGGAFRQIPVTYARADEVEE
jgi:hypothetical protein